MPPYQMAQPSTATPPQVDPLRGNYGGNDFTSLANASREPGLGAQLTALGQYQSDALGNGPSLAEMQLKQQSDQQMAQALAMGASSLGGSQMAMGAQNSAGMQLNAAAAQQRAAEIAQAQAAVGQISGQLYGQGQNYDQLAMQQGLGAEQNSLDWYSAKRGMDMQQDQRNKEWTMGLIQAGAAAGGGILGGLSQMSDERVKNNVAPGGMNATQTVGALEPKTFEYKPGFGDPGQRVGIMAQDLLKTPEGAAIVRDTPYGYSVDTGGLASLGVAAASENVHEIAALKQQVAQLTGLLGVNPAAGPPGGGSTTSQQYVRNGLGM
jgi:hypothetical protein